MNRLSIYTCRDYEAWPKEKKDYPIEFITEEHRELIAERCSNEEEPVMPNLPTTEEEVLHQKIASLEAELNNPLRALERMIASKDKDIAYLRATIADKDRLLSLKDEEISRKDTTIASKDREIASG